MAHRDKFSNFEPSVQERLFELESLRFEEPEKAMQLAYELDEIALNKRDDELIGYAEFYIGDAAYTLCDLSKCVKHIRNAIKYFEKTGNWYKISGCYNLLGVLFANQGDVANSLTSFGNSLEISEKHKDIFSVALVYENYSEVCSKCQNYETALAYGLMAKETIFKCKNIERWDYYLLLIQITIANIYLNLKRYDESKKILDEIDDLRKDSYSVEVEFDERIVRLLWMAKCDKTNESEQLIKVMKDFDECVCLIDFFPYIKSLMEYLLEKNELEYLKHILEVMEKAIDKDAYPEIQLQMSDIKVELLLRANDKARLLEEMLKYREYFRQYRKQSNLTLDFLMNLKYSLDNISQDNKRLLESVSTDDLTGILNRRGIDEQISKFFLQSSKSRQNFAVEMMDVDHFKEINDNYGHEMGDRCLNLVATVLNDFKDSRCVCGRYGGDEFIIAFHNMTENEILEVGNKISANLRTESKKHNMPVVKVSQGICIGIPDATNSRIRDYIVTADKALYESKNTGRDGITIQTV